MRLSPISSVSFGIISHDAINTIRSHAEGFHKNTSGKNNKSNEYYDNDPKYKMMNESQLIRMFALTQYAGELKKSIIAQSVKKDSKGTKRTDSGLMVYTKQGVLKTFELPKSLKGDADKCLDVLQEAVKTAQEYEDNPSNPDLEYTNKTIEVKRKAKNSMQEAVYTHEGKSYTGYGYEYPNNKKFNDRFKTPLENEILNSIYNEAKNITRDKF